MQRKPVSKSKVDGPTTTYQPIRWKHYPITGKTLSEAARQIDARGHAGETTWEPRASWRTANGVVTSALVNIALTVEMPQWTMANRLPEADLVKWRAFLTALKAHELRHIELAKRHLDSLAGRLIGLTESDAGAMVTATVDQLNVASKSYDDATDHGRTEGAELTAD